MNNQEIKKTLFHPTTKKYNFLANLKLNSDYDSFKKMYKGIKAHPFGKHALLSNPLPKSFADLRKNNITPHSGNVETEISWLMYSIFEYPEKLVDFVEKKNRFEKKLLLNDFDEALQILDDIDNNICHSNWSAECRLLLAELDKGTEGNWLQLNDFAKLVKDPLSLFILEQSSKKAEEKISYSSYKNNFENLINGIDDLLREYLCFKIFYTGYVGFENYSFIANVESISSIIDRYLIIVDVLTELILTDKSSFVLKVLSDLNELIPNDRRLSQIYNIVSKDFIQFIDNAGIIEYLNSYTIGNFQYCVDNIDLFKNNTNTLELYVVYVKSLIELEKKFKKTNVSSSVDEILQRLYDVFTLNESFNISLEYLLKLSLKYFSFNFGKQLFAIASKLANLSDNKNTHQVYYLVNSVLNNPLILNFTNALETDIVDNLFKDFKACSDSPFIKLNVNINRGNFKDIIDNPDYSIRKRALYTAKAMFVAKEYDKLIDYLEKSLFENKISIITEKEVIEILFAVYLIKKSTKKALILYIDSFFKNKHLVNRLNTLDLLNNVEKASDLTGLIDLPIFYFITKPDIYEQYVRYDEFLEYNQRERPNELFEDDSIRKDKLIYFLRELCNIEIMHHSLHFEGTDDIENERVNILKHLLFIDSDNESEYIKEITEITQKSKIRKAIREVNKGRITVNPQQLKSKEEATIKDNFSRFQELIVFSNLHNLKSLDSTSKMLNEYFGALNDKSLRDKVVNINDPAFIAFKAMFIDLRDKFVLSKDFGLDGYLSTRIRHGTFLNHIRSNFEASNLVSQKKEGIYSNNAYWEERTPLILHFKSSEIQESIKKFSKNIDDFTEYIIQELIQVKTEKYNSKPNAFFDFSLTNESLAFMFKETKNNINSYNAFLDFVFEYLEAILEIKLKEIRELFKGDIKDHYTNLINDFDNEIRGVIGDNTFVDLTNSIVKCQTNIQNEIENIAEWFNISNPTSDLVLDVETIIQSAIEITNTIYPNQTISPSIEVKTDLPFASGTTSLIYIFRILLDNIIKHSGLPKEKRNVKIYSEIKSDNLLEIKVSNEFSKSKLSEIKEKLEINKKNWLNQQSEFDKSNVEGGSGFDKIRRILAVDMKMKNYVFDYKINGNRLTIIIDIEIRLMEK
jgi:hypothetical protein